MAAGQLVVVPEHGPLQFEPLAEERQCLHLSLLFLATGAVGGEGWDILDEPNIGAGRNLLVSVDLLLFEGPIRKRCCMGPHSDFARVVNELEVARNGFEFLVLLATLDTDFEQSIGGAVAICIRDRHGCELLVGGVVRRGNIVRQKDGVGTDMAQSYKVVVPDVTTEFLLFLHGREDFPHIVGIVVWVARHLLALAGNTAIVVSQRIPLVVAVEIGLGLLMLDGDRIIVVDGDGIRKHHIVAEGFLELGGHEIVARAGASKYGEMDLEPEKVEQEWDDDQAEGASCEMLEEKR